ncbi:MAG: tyrosine-type recombinase/integrase [Dactylosporangium sp.]|nr:tyrosine-type recombinase/integrase [Dactylosporangium sp.]NNJ63526.1 tyrosine-type recombinase/integrase [Dactylosporangium sp.]
MSTYDVRIWSIEEHRGRDRKTGKPRSTYRVRWVAAGKRFGDNFQTRALAESFRSKLVIAQREGVAFDEPTGLPEPMARELNSRSWYDHAVAYVDVKWPRAAARQRKSIAESLATVTPAMFATDRGRPCGQELRAALYGWTFNKARRSAGPPPEHLASTVAWLEANTVKLADLADAARIRNALDLLALRLDGRPAAPTTIARKRAVFYGALRYAVELQLLDGHPMDRVQWSAPRMVEEVDRRVVVNPKQAAALLDAVDAEAPHLTGFFGCMYYAAMRPAEVMHLRAEECDLPERGWGRLRLTGSTQHVGEDWGDTSGTKEDRELKHRGRGATRDVPAPPALVGMLRRHLAEHGTAQDGRLFGSRDAFRNPVSSVTYTRIWRRVREKVLIPVQQRSPLARVPYHLRHAAVSLWLNAGVPATQVAEWAGHSVHVLLKVYAKCIDGQDEAARRRIEAALRFDDDPDVPKPTGSSDS